MRACVCARRGEPCAQRRVGGVCRILVALLLVPSTIAFAQVSNQTATTTQWTYEERPDPFAGGQIALAVMEAPDATMMVRCWSASGSLDVRLSVRPELGPLVTDTVAVRFDDRPEQRTNWVLLPGGFGYEVPSDARAALMFGMKVGSLMSVHVDNNIESDAAADLIRLRIPLRGSQAAINAVLARCR